jgi:protein-L-isoaspartate(D-aspartate) O-methyltransferase
MDPERLVFDTLGVTEPFDEARAQMVETQILGRGITDPRVVAAMRTVPREEFVPFAERERAYADGPIPIGEEQTISQPYVVAVMLAALALRGDEKVLEVGAGSGYAAALLGRCARQVWAVERIAKLAAEARERIAKLGYTNVHVLHGDGTLGLVEQAPFDAILVSAGAAEVPAPLLAQLAVGGRLVMPLGDPGAGREGQRLWRIERTGESTYRREPMEPVRFVPLIAGT